MPGSDVEQTVSEVHEPDVMREEREERKREAGSYSRNTQKKTDGNSTLRPQYMALTLTSRYSDIRLSKLGRTHLVDTATISRTSLKSSKSSMHLWFARNVTTSTTGRAESGIVRRGGPSPARDTAQYM